MNRKEFGSLVIALRSEHTDNYNRPWTRMKLAEEAELSDLLVGNIERGSKVNLDTDVLIRLARVLKLTSNERKEFFSSATTVDEKDIARELDYPNTTLEETLHLMSQIQLPSFLIDGFGNVIATNIALMTIYDIDQDAFLHSNANPIIVFNLMRLFFGPEFERQRKMMGDTWQDFSFESVAVFRTLSFRHRAHPLFRMILGELNKFEEFKQSWYTVSLQNRDYNINNGKFTLDHPRFGKISCHTSNIEVVTRHGDLGLYPIIPLDSNTAKVFASVIDQTGVTPVQLALWPNEG